MKSYGEEVGGEEPGRLQRVDERKTLVLQGGGSGGKVEGREGRVDLELQCSEEQGPLGRRCAGVAKW
jgi:hypothetical protein